MYNNPPLKFQGCQFEITPSRPAPGINFVPSERVIAALEATLTIIKAIKVDSAPNSTQATDKPLSIPPEDQGGAFNQKNLLTC